MLSGRAKYILRRLHSLSGVLPLAVFIAEHYFTNAHAIAGAESFNAATGRLHEMPYLWAMEIAIVIGPLLYHSIYGLFITREADPNVDAYPTYQNLAYVAQRVTGVILALFIVFHVYETRVQDYLHQFGLGGAEVDYAYMANYFSPLWIKAVYIIGLASIAFHLGNGLFNFAFKWGITVSEKAQQAMIKISVVTSIVLFAIGLNILFAFK
jgi:succinate dehydrogenase / fumarate reductase cytochrome b subunit